MTARLLTFALASLALIALPGPNLVYIVTRTAAQGLRAGVASALGVEAGTLFHLTLAGLGVSALIAASPVAFAAVKYTGAAYLVFLAIKALKRSEPAAEGAAPEAAPLWRIFADGALVNVLNPKVAVFFLAFLPQFVRSGAELPWFCTVFFILALAADLGYCFAAQAIGPWLRRRAGGGRWIAVVYLSLAALAGFS